MLSAKRTAWKKFSRACSKWIPAQKKEPILSQSAYNRFMKAFPVIIDNTLQKSDFMKSPERVKRIIEYNTRNEGQVQGEIIVLCNEVLQETGKVGDELAYKQHVLAWCAELMFTYAVVTDDFEEGSKTRFNKPCWHLLPDVESLIINDAVTVLCFLYEMLRQNFDGPTYTELIKIFNETILKLTVGQSLDVMTSANKNYKNFTMDHFETVAFYKLGFYSLIVPVRAALVLSNKYNKESDYNVSDILTDVGIWSQINNDFQDFFNEDASTGKTGSDIEMGKCTWLAVTALQRCNDAQRKEFEECYGSWEPSHVNRIRELYKDLNIIDIYFEEEKSCYNNAIHKIESLPSNATPSRDFFRHVVNKYFANLSYKLKL